MAQSLEIATGTGTVFEDTAVVAVAVGTTVAVTGADVAVGVIVVAGADVAVVASADVAAGADVAAVVVVVAGAVVVVVVGTFLQPRPGGGSADAYWVAAATTEIATTVASTASLFALVTICSPSYSRGLPVRLIRPKNSWETATCHSITMSRTHLEVELKSAQR